MKDFEISYRNPNEITPNPVMLNQPIPANKTIDYSWYGKFVEFMDVHGDDTLATYKNSLKQFFIFLDRENITRPNRDDIMTYRDQLMAAHKSGSTVHLYLTVVKMFFRFTANAGLYPNVADHIKSGKISKRHKRDFLTADQAKKLLETMPKNGVLAKRNYAMVILMVITGLRTVELHRALYGDISMVAGNYVLWVLGKGRDEKNEYVKLPGHVYQAIMDYTMLRGKMTPNTPLFASISHNSYDQALTTRSIRSISKQALKNAGFDSPRLTAHSFRHTAATLNMLNHGSIEETQQLLRHSNINTTMIYNHELDRVRNASENRIEDAIFNDD